MYLPQSRNHNIKSFVFFFGWILFFVPTTLLAQLNVTINGSANSLAQSIVGNGITVSNAQLSAGLSSNGTFTYSGTHLGITNGVLLTSGFATDAASPASTLASQIIGNNLNDHDVTAISPQAQFDATILEFDFMPTCDTLSITYVFGSEEYPRYLNQYNDVFAMFLTGLNPAGGNYTSYNIATLPNGVTPVSINTVNGGWPIGTGASNPSYYVDNYTHPVSDIVYDGYTIPITSKVAVLPCQPYHLKIAVVDAGNGRYDSGVFIEENAFTCTTSPVASMNTTVSCGSNGTASVTVSNYTGTPTYHWFPGGATTSSISGLTAGNYYCVVTFPGSCIPDTVMGTVGFSGPQVVSFSSDTICLGDTISLAATANGGNSPYVYNWTQGGTVVSPTIQPVSTATYLVTATDMNGCVSAPDSVTIVVRSALQVNAGSPLSICEKDTTILQLNVSGGDGTYSYHWSPAINMNNDTLSAPSVFPNQTTTYTVAVNDGCNNSVITKQVIVKVNPLPRSFITTNQSMGCAPICVQFSDTASSDCMNGVWKFSDGTSAPGCGGVQHCFQTPGKYSVSHLITTNEGCSATDTVKNIVEAFAVPVASFTFSPDPPLLSFPDIYFHDNSENSFKPFWIFENDSLDTTSAADPTHVHDKPGCFKVTLIATSAKGCKDTADALLCMEEELSIYIPNSFTPNGDGINDQFLPIGSGIEPDDFNLMIFNRWGNLIFSSNNLLIGWNGYFKTTSLLCPEDVYVYHILAKDYKNELHEFNGKITLIY